MTTLIAAYDSSGCIGRCGARCYNAKGDRCRCICGGRNHAVGLKNALENSREIGPEEYDKWPGWEKAEKGKVWVTRYLPLSVAVAAGVEVGSG